VTGVVIMAAADKIRAEIEQLGVEAVAPGMAAVAMELAEAFEDAEAPTSKAVVARELSAVMKVLRSIAPVGEEGDVVDDLATRRAERRGA
jgi:ribosomal protein L7/L12